MRRGEAGFEPDAGRGCRAAGLPGSTTPKAAILVSAPDLYLGSLVQASIYSCCELSSDILVNVNP